MDTMNILSVFLDKTVTYIDHITEHIWKALVLQFYILLFVKSKDQWGLLCMDTFNTFSISSFFSLT